MFYTRAMSGGHGESGGAMRDLKWIFLIILALFALWYFTGGPQRSRESGKNPFINPLYPVGDGDTYGPKAPKENFVDPVN